MLEVVCRQGRGTLTQDTEHPAGHRGNPGDPRGDPPGDLVDKLESTLLPGSTVSADRAGVPSGDGGYGVGHHASWPLSAPAVAVATSCMGVSSTTSCLSCAL